MEISKMIKKCIVLSVVVLIALAFCSMPAMAVDLIADGGSDDTAIVVGEVTVESDGNSLVVTIATDDPWVLGETHVAVASDCAYIPQTKKGNARPGKFPYESGEEIPMALEDGETIYIAAQAVVTTTITVDGVDLTREESAWGEGEDLPGNDWSMCFPFTYEAPTP